MLLQEPILHVDENRFVLFPIRYPTVRLHSTNSADEHFIDVDSQKLAIVMVRVQDSAEDFLDSGGN